jgi:Ca2+-binding EF-hand superfamily protein
MLSSLTQTLHLATHEDGSEQKAAADQPLSPYSYFYPASAESGADAESQTTRRPKEDRRTLRERRKMFFKAHAANFDQYNTSNLQIVHKTFTQFVDFEGNLPFIDYSDALRDLGVTDEDLIRRTFGLFDIHRTGVVEYREIITALDVILNGTNQRITVEDCFHVVDPGRCGYIIRPVLLEYRSQQKETDGLNHLMIKVLLELLTKVEEEDAAQRAKGGLKLRGMRLAPKVHMDVDEFHGFLKTNPLLVQAFMAQVLLTMESVYQRNKAAAARIAQRQATAKEDDATDTGTIVAGAKSLRVGSGAPSMRERSLSGSTAVPALDARSRPASRVPSINPALGNDDDRTPLGTSRSSLHWRALPDVHETGSDVSRHASRRQSLAATRRGTRYHLDRRETGMTVTEPS